MKFDIIVATEQHVHYADDISGIIKIASEQRGTGIANRTSEYIKSKILAGHAIIALHNTSLAGFCYVETWSHHKYAANSGLIVADEYRNIGLAAKIKLKAFQHSRTLYPEAKLFGITTSLPVMKINSALGYKPVTFSELTNDEAFWKGCSGCKNHDILLRNDHKMCLCTGMLFDPTTIENAKPIPKSRRWERFKQFLKERALRIKKYNLEKND